MGRRVLGARGLNWAINIARVSSKFLALLPLIVVFIIRYTSFTLAFSHVITLLSCLPSKRLQEALKHKSLYFFNLFHHRVLSAVGGLGPCSIIAGSRYHEGRSFHHSLLFIQDVVFVFAEALPPFSPSPLLLVIEGAFLVLFLSPSKRL